MSINKDNRLWFICSFCFSSLFKLFSFTDRHLETIDLQVKSIRFGIIFFSFHFTQHKFQYSTDSQSRLEYTFIDLKSCNFYHHRFRLNSNLDREFDYIRSDQINQSKWRICSKDPTITVWIYPCSTSLYLRLEKNCS